MVKKKRYRKFAGILNLEFLFEASHFLLTLAN